MIKRFSIYFFLFLLLCGSRFSWAQHPKDMSSSRRQNMFGKELFIYQNYNFADSTSEELSCMEFHFGVVNDILTFVKTEDDQFRARYEISIIIYNDKSEALVEKSVSHRVNVDNFAETNSRSNSRHHAISVSLPPGRYRGVLKLTDSESGETISQDLDLTFRGFQRDVLHLSDIMFLDKIDSSQTAMNYTPTMQNIFEALSSAFSAYLEIYPPLLEGTVNVQLSITDAKEQKVLIGNHQYSANRRSVPIIIPFREHLTRPGDYILRIDASIDNQTAKIQRMFSVAWANISMESDNIELAIEQLSAVAHKRTLDSMRAADEQERKRIYDQFWRDRDPTPETEKNELQEEYYKRIDFCNRNFTEISSGRQGWQTDRGKVYLVYGPPDHVEHMDAEVNIPSSETWQYNRLNRRYFFADRSGNGVYRLIKVE